MGDLVKKGKEAVGKLDVTGFYERAGNSLSKPGALRGVGRLVTGSTVLGKEVQTPKINAPPLTDEEAARLRTEELEDVARKRAQAGFGTGDAILTAPIFGQESIGGAGGGVL